MAEIYRCKEPFVYWVDGTPITVTAGVLATDADDAYKKNPDAFETALSVATRQSGKKSDTVEAATAAPGEKRTTTRRKEA
jgi:hypothetical protein